MGVLDKLSQRQSFGGDLVRQAMQAAKADPAERQKLGALVQQRPQDFEDPRVLHQVRELLKQFDKDCYETVPNLQSATIGRAEVFEARITKVEDKQQTIDITPPPPQPPVYRRDPLNIAGKATANSRVEFYNASQPGRPVLGHAQTDAAGNFSYELTDETKFKYGDQIGVRIVGRDSERGRPLIVPTEPFLITNLETTYVRRNPAAPNGVEVVRVDRTSSQRPLDKNTDHRQPFFQQNLVRPSLEVPSEVGQPYTLSLVGLDDAVEPNSRITVKVGRETYETTVDELGRFALKVRDVTPGQALTIEVRDINGNGVDIPARVPSVGMDAASIARGITLGDVLGEGGLDVSLKGLPPAGGLIVRNVETGVVSELVADQDGRIKATLPGVGAFQPFEFAVRDVNGHISEKTELAVVTDKGAQLASDLHEQEPDLAAALQHVCGPPFDRKAHGVVDPRGPFLPLTGLSNLPPHSTLDVLKDGVVVQRFRADDCGRIADPELMGVHIDDRLTFQLRDVAGRRFPTEVVGFTVSAGHPTTKVSGHVPPALTQLSPHKVGTGTLALDPLWLTPAKVLVGDQCPADFQARHAVLSMAGGALLERPSPMLMKRFFPELKADQGASLTLTQAQGAKTLTLALPGTEGSPFSFGFDDALGTVTPRIGPNDIGRAGQALKAALAFVAIAQSQGKEPGDPAYDRALGAAHTMLFLLDRVATQSPEHADAARQAAAGAWPKEGFPFQITARDVVPPCGDAQNEPVNTLSSSSLNLLQARTLALGAVGETRHSGAALPVVDLANVVASSTFEDGVLSIAGRGLVKAGDTLAVKVGDAVHIARADVKGAVTLRIEGLAPGSMIEIAQQGPEVEGRQPRKQSPIIRALLTETDIVGEHLLVPLDALVQRAPDLARIVDVLHGKTSARGIDATGVGGLSPLGSLVFVKDGLPIATARADAKGVLTESIALKQGEILDVQVLDAAGRPFAPTLKNMVLGIEGTGTQQLNVDALSLQSVIAAVGTGTLGLPAFPKRGPYGEKATSELHAELHPTWGHSSSMEDNGDRISTKAAFPAGLLPELAKGDKPAHSKFGDSVRLGAWQWDSGEVILSAGYYVDNQRPDFAFTINPKLGTVTDRGTGKPVVVPDGLAKLTTLLQTSIAFTALGQKLGSEPGDGFYDVATRVAKSALACFDVLIAKNPTFRTEILAAMQAALPAAMPFDLQPAGNAVGPQQTAAADRPLASEQRFWRAVDRAQFDERVASGNAFNFGVDFKSQGRDGLAAGRGPLWSVPTTNQTEPFFKATRGRD